MLRKHTARRCGRAGNDLPDCLAGRGIYTVFVTGVATNLLVERRARHGTDLGLTVHTVSDCIATANDATLTSGPWPTWI
jgi:biuret amidohydrolase